MACCYLPDLALGDPNGGSEFPAYHVWQPPNPLERPPSADFNGIPLGQDNQWELCAKEAPDYSQKPHN